MNEAEVRRELRGFIEDNFLYLHPNVELADGDDMLARGVLDSLGFVELVEEVQTSYGVTVDDVEITEENFGSDRRHRQLRSSQARRAVSARTLGRDLRAAAAHDPDKTAILAPDRTLAYGELDRAADRCSRSTP